MNVEEIVKDIHQSFVPMIQFTVSFLMKSLIVEVVKDIIKKEFCSDDLLKMQLKKLKPLSKKSLFRLSNS